MSSNPNPILTNLLSGLAQTNQVVSLAVAGADVLVPLIKGAILEFKKLKDNADGTVEFSVILKTGQDDLTQDATNFQDALDLVNAELKRLGQPPVGPTT